MSSSANRRKDAAAAAAKANKSLAFYLKSSLTPGVQLQNEDALNIMFVVRQIFGILIGLLAGSFKFEGFAVIIFFFIISFAFVYVYGEKYLGLDPLKFEENELYIEAFGLSFMEFLLTWTLANTYL
jgi:hypothetical protein